MAQPYRPAHAQHNGWHAAPQASAAPGADRAQRDRPAAALDDQSGHQAFVVSLGMRAGAPRGDAEYAEADSAAGRIPMTYGRDGHEPFHPEVRGDVGALIDSLHEVFARDRAIATQGSSARCGLCYLHYPVAELDYRDDGYYICASCQRGLGNAHVPMVRRQQR